MSKQSVFAAIDVGTNKVCSIIANKGDNDGLRILGVGVVPSRGVRKGIVIDVDETREAIRESVRKAEMTSGVKVESAYIGISGRHVSSANTSSAVAISRGDRVVHTRDLKRVFGDVRNVKVSPDRQLLHVIPRGYSL
ncbi:MAG: cell division protein FtsA, partial [Chloroflexota bacterium]